jgi:serine/threonine-protein kinase
MPSLVGQTLCNRYRVDDQIGRGGMAEVYKVWDKDRTTYLALKLLREDLAQDRVFLRRFKREAQTLAKLQHPNIVRFYGLEQDDMLAFMLMDFVEGTSLRAEIFQLDGEPMATERIVEIMRPVCSALNYAHNQGMVHCDAKPGNIMIDSSGKVLVTDFGIARMTDSATATMVLRYLYHGGHAHTRLHGTRAGSWPGSHPPG